MAPLRPSLQSAVKQINRKIAEAKNEINLLHEMQKPAANMEVLEEAVTNCKIALDFFETQTPPSADGDGQAVA